MPRLKIDNQPVEVPEESTILDAARKLGLDIPTLCFKEGCRPQTSCMVCLVKMKGQSRFVPSCATLAADGMEIESETDEVHNLRRTGLELLLADHLGDCVAPCQHTCPAGMDIPLMLDQVSEGELGQAIKTIKEDIALPATLGRVCPEVCELGCRRKEVDSPAAICMVKRHVADQDLASDAPYIPELKPTSGKSVAIVGGGPTGLAATYHLLTMGHACTLIDDQPKLGGGLRRDFDETKLPRDVLDGEIAIIERMGATFRTECKVGRDESLSDLQNRFDAVLLAIGAAGAAEAESLDVTLSADRIKIDRQTYQTSLAEVFAAGDAVLSNNKLVIRSVAEGKAVAQCIDRFLTGEPVARPAKEFTVRGGRFSAEEAAQLAVDASSADRMTPSGGVATGFSCEEALAEANRCLHCHCAHYDGCNLRRYADLYGASNKRFRRPRNTFERNLNHPDIAYEPGKCIVCGLCIQIATDANEPLGLTFVGRGFDIRIGVPFDGTLEEGLQRVARQCAEACPSGALSLRRPRTCGGGGGNGCSTCSPEPPSSKNP